jgi:hypothetical protein
VVEERSRIVALILWGRSAAGNGRRIVEECSIHASWIIVASCDVDVVDWWQ